ncbi:MAG: hypothetical protein O3C43_19215 [Verrucomicrobia bacterium]|nr:hypothetical protein [Verrucomicrobiota bacterium]MDA1068620.1 hypothetical protein [Verrucomicrobiota bacterium]
MDQFKPLEKLAIPSAIEKAKHYRLLNEASAAESICRDILRVEPDNQKVLVILVLAMCDQFGTGYKVAPGTVLEIIGRLENEYERVYYTGISHERNGMAYLRSGSPGARFMAYDCFCDALEWYEKAEKLSPEHNNDSVLRWNTCTRLIERNRLEPMPGEGREPFLE